MIPNLSDKQSASRVQLHPMLFQPNRKTLVWGTEDWTVSAVAGSESVIANGPWAGQKLSDIIAQYPQEILGREVAEKYNNQMPLLTKIIDAKQDLSIQVHPNDEMAKRVHNKFGKSEMWYILDAEPGSFLYAGFKEKITPEEYKQLVEDAREIKFSNSQILDNKKKTILDVLAKHEVHPGDVFYLPAGRVHAIGGGIRLAEVQQSSDVTYRIYDYNRPGLDGRPRELHTELASQAIDYTVYPEYKTESGKVGEGRDKILNTPYFSVNVIETSQPFHRDMRKYDSFIILMNIGTDCKIRLRAIQEEVTLPANASCLIPAALADYDILPTSSPSSLTAHRSSLPANRVLESFINNRKSLGTLITDFFRL